MSGHSKWSQIKHKKALTDARKGVAFGKLSRAISMAARGNPDPATNLRLKGEIERARSFNMPLDNIERAIRRVSDTSADALAELQLEVMGPGSVGFLVLAITDNSNRTMQELKQLAASHGGRIASPGSIAWMFRKAGVLRIPLANQDVDALQLAAIDAGADTVDVAEEELVVTCPPERLNALQSVLAPAPLSTTLEFLPTTFAPQPTGDDLARIENLESAFEDHNDVQSVFTNVDPTHALSRH